MSNANEPAFPMQRYIPKEGGGFLDLGEYMAMPEGLTKREYFAAMALQGLLSWGPDAYDCKYVVAARAAVAHADSLIAALKLTPDELCQVRP
jgi:hypothetical protein